MSDPLKPIRDLLPKLEDAALRIDANNSAETRREWRAMMAQLRAALKKSKSNLDKKVKQ